MVFKRKDVECALLINDILMKKQAQWEWKKNVYFYIEASRKLI